MYFFRYYSSNRNTDPRQSSMDGDNRPNTPLRQNNPLVMNFRKYILFYHSPTDILTLVCKENY